MNGRTAIRLVSEVIEHPQSTPFARAGEDADTAVRVPSIGTHVASVDGLRGLAQLGPLGEALSGVEEPIPLHDSGGFVVRDLLS